MPQPKKGRSRRRVRKNISYGQAHIKTSFNNTIVTLTDTDGNVIAWESAGSAGFKGSRKSTPFAAQVTADSAARKGMEHGLERVEVLAKGAGSGRETAIRSLQAAGKMGESGNAQKLAGKTKAPPLLPAAREAVPQLLRPREPPAGRDGREPAPDARDPPRQRPRAARLRRLPPPGAPAREPRPLAPERPPRRHPLIPGEAGRRDLDQGRLQGHRRRAIRD